MLKQKWRENQNNFKQVTLNDKDGLSKQHALPAKEEMRRLLNTHEEWQSYEYKLCKEVGGLFRVFTIFKGDCELTEYKDAILKRHMVEIEQSEDIDHKLDLLLAFQKDNQ